MKFTSEERQEVAARLRDFPLALSISMQKGVKNKALAVICDLMDIVSVDHGEPESLYARLADLIDPTCHGIEERESDGIGAPPRYTSHCSNCGQLWDETSGIPRFPAYCPNCGRRVMK